LLALGLVGGCGEAQHAAAPELPNPVHVAADSERARADGSESHPFPSLADAAAAIGHDESWQGTVLVHAGRYEHPLDVVLPPTAALEIEAGATFAMGPNVSLHVRGEVNARGSEGKPISFTWLAEGEHWSGFTVTGPSPSESVFEHVIVEHGYESVSEVDGVPLQGALSFSHASARISHCIFRDNEGFGALHFNVAGGHVEFSEFSNNHEDGLKSIDSPGGIEIDHNSFLDNTNDAIKVIGAVASIHENLINGCGDKGISASRSSVSIEHNVIAGCGTGIVNKGGSTLSVASNTLYGNAYGFASLEPLVSSGPNRGTFTGNILWNATDSELALAPTDQTVFSYDCIENLRDRGPGGKVNGDIFVNANGAVGDGEGIISKGNGCDDPLFANPDLMDFRLRSEAGRFDSASEEWLRDDATSPCIDAGPPSADASDEPAPNGGRINLGYDGGTAEASLSRE
jgi:hypothetical protein